MVNDTTNSTLQCLGRFLGRYPRREMPWVDSAGLVSTVDKALPPARYRTTQLGTTLPIRACCVAGMATTAVRMTLDGDWLQSATAQQAGQPPGQPGSRESGRVHPSQGCPSTRCALG